MKNLNSSSKQKTKYARHIQRLVVAGLMMLSLATLALAQAGGGNAELQQKVAALKQSTAANQQKLHKYQWTEIQQVTLKSETKPQQEFMCQYGPDGKVQKTPLTPPGGAAPQQQAAAGGGRGGRLKEKVVATKGP